MSAPEILSGGRPHTHVDPETDSPNVHARDYRWNTVIRSSCGHLYVRRHSMGWILPMGDHFPQWVRLRPWHVVANLKVGARGFVTFLEEL